MRLTPDLIAAAIAGYSAQKQHIDEKIAELRGMMPGATPEPAESNGPPVRKKRRLSAKGRRAIAEGARKRWALLRQEKEKAGQSAPAQKTARKKTAGKRASSAAVPAAAKPSTKKAPARKAAAKKAGAKKAAVKKAVAKKAPSKTAAAKKSTPPPTPAPEAIAL
jgi:membrane protein involved in colicin uptake